MADTAEGEPPELLYMENENYHMVDALPYIDTQLGQVEVAQQVKGLIEEEMRHFEPRDYLASLPEPEFPLLASETVSQELKRVSSGEPLAGIDLGRYQLEQPQGQLAQDHGAWRKAAEAAHMQLEYNRLRRDVYGAREKPLEQHRAVSTLVIIGDPPVHADAHHCLASGHVRAASAVRGALLHHGADCTYDCRIFDAYSRRENLGSSIAKPEAVVVNVEAP
ncbi:unnamed protein product [Prorocentrum cordatum]|uniref:Uncharacterized protein n=1 Tax=Prorocentrum cordatum TaxID=2364126 RepID=A0ABN9SX54_9DINO|nr:unnamed protein product [Polarella glacialis]